ncbi:hypothetical protein C8R44DRAFT_886919 [Mycena epipterygia]|nr:hypothetical protein C8R44DRAFT_886919 [Mycena epipterygia]
MSNPNDLEGLFACPQNKLDLSRTFGYMKISRAVVDPNLRISNSLLHSSSPSPNLVFSLVVGYINAAVEVLPFAPDTVHAEVQKSYERQSHQVHIKLRLIFCFFFFAADSQRARPTARIYFDPSSTLGQTRVYLPRGFTGPLTVRSWARMPHFSREVQRVAAPFKLGTLSHWFVGDLAAWGAEGKRGDGARR